MLRQFSTGFLRPKKSIGVFPSKRMRKNIGTHKLLPSSSKKVLITAGMGLRDD